MKYATMARSNLLFFTALLAAAPGHVAAEAGAIVQVSAITSARLAVYKSAANDSKLKELDKEGIALPLEVFETADENRFLKVNIGGDFVWVKKTQVGTLRAVTAGCLAQTAAPEPAGVIRGGNRGCSK